MVMLYGKSFGKKIEGLCGEGLSTIVKGKSNGGTIADSGACLGCRKILASHQ